MDEPLRRALVAGGLVGPLAALAWVTGSPLVFPSLGPSAYLLAVRPDAPACRPRRVVGGHLVGVLAGFAAYHLLAPGLSVTGAFAPLSAAGLRLGASAVVATGATTLGMGLADLGHAPACATTLILSLGLLSTPREAAGIGLAVVVLVAVHAGVCRAVGLGRRPPEPTRDQ
jgi:hypothetical protein